MAVATHSAPIGEGDSEDLFFEDIVKSGKYLNNQKLVDVFSKEAARL